MKGSIRALLLAGGYGTRLKPITNQIPKCLIEVGGIPMLGRWLEKLDKVGCSGAIVNTHYLANKVDEFIKNNNHYATEVVATYEPTLLGTAGTLIATKDYFAGTTVIMAHVDNATDLDLKWLIDKHKRRPNYCNLTMLTFETDKPEACGIVQCDENNVVKCFYEKCKDNHGNQANGAVYVFDNTLIEDIITMDSGITDFSLDVLPKLVGKIYTAHWSGPFIDMGTPENLEKARRVWPNPIELT